MRPLVVERLPEYTELVVPVAGTSTIRVKGCGYSVPSRLIGERVRVHLYEHRVEVYYADKLELACDRPRERAARRGAPRSVGSSSRHLGIGGPRSLGGDPWCPGCQASC